MCVIAENTVSAANSSSATTAGAEIVGIQLGKGVWELQFYYYITSGSGVHTSQLNRAGQTTEPGLFQVQCGSVAQWTGRTIRVVVDGAPERFTVTVVTNPSAHELRAELHGTRIG